MRLKKNTLTERQRKFANAYKISGDQTQAARIAGYSEKGLAVTASKLVRHPNIIAEIEDWSQKKRQELKKEDFVDLALQDYKQLEVKHSNKPRFLDIAGRALGYLGTDKPSSTTNVQINNVSLSGNESQAELWEITRKLLGQQ